MEQVKEILSKAIQGPGKRNMPEVPTLPSKSENSVAEYVLKNIARIMRARKCPAAFLDAELSQCPAAIKSQFDHEKSYLLTGPCGIGKSYIAAAMMKEIISRHASKAYFIGDTLRMFNVQFISAPELLLKIRDSFEPGAMQSELDLIYWYSSIDCLILDDLGAEKATEWTLQTLYTIINNRMTEQKQTIITSNLDLDGLSDKLSDRVASRLKGMCKHIAMTGQDRRMKDQKQAAGNDTR